MQSGTLSIPHNDPLRFGVSPRTNLIYINIFNKAMPLLFCAVAPWRFRISPAPFYPILHGMLIAFIGLSPLSLTRNIFHGNYGVMRGVLCSHHSRSTAQK
jgi:hypothetical protein